VKRAVIKSFEGMGREEPDGYVSPDPENDAFTLRMLVGSADTPGMESFDVLVCTPGWLAKEVREHGPQVGRHMLILETLDLAQAQTFLRRRVEQLMAPAWSEIAEKIARLGYWEFEDYQP
jgi:hypothetical protein